MMMAGILRDAATRKRLFRLGSAAALMTITLFDAGALQTTLTWQVGDKMISFQESISLAGGRVDADIASSVGEYDSLVLDERRSTLEWKRRVDAEGTSLVATRDGAWVRISGTFKGKPYDKALDFGDLPWYEFQELSYEYFFMSEAATTAFWTIDRKTLKPSRFVAERDGEETIAVMGKTVLAIRYGLSVNGVPHFIFKAHFWLREKDGRFLRLDVPPIFNLPRSVVELTGES
jgi:hypothetical protein